MLDFKMKSFENMAPQEDWHTQQCSYKRTHWGTLGPGLLEQKKKEEEEEHPWLTSSSVLCTEH